MLTFTLLCIYLYAVPRVPVTETQPFRARDPVTGTLSQTPSLQLGFRILHWPCQAGDK